MSGAWDAVAGLLGFGGPSGNDHGSSNWAAWGHQEIRSMLDHSVDAGDIDEAAQAWRDQALNDAAIVTGLTRDLQQTVSGGWRGAAADAALAPLDAINQWSASHTDIADHTARLMADSGFAAGQAKATVPPPKSHNWMETLAVTALTGPAGGITDAVMQEQEQSDAHAEAVRIMTDVYSAPINDHRGAVPTYSQLADPTLQPPEVAPAAATGIAAGGYFSGGASGPSAGPAGAGSGAHVMSAPTTLQAVTGADHPASHVGGGAVAPDQAARAPHYGGGQIGAVAAAAAAAAAGAAPFAGDLTRRARAAVSGVRFGGGQSAGGRAGAGHAAQFGPRPTAAVPETEGRLSAGPGRGTSVAAAGRAGAGEMMAPVGGAGGKRGEDAEHRRPSYLIEMDDVFTDGRRVAPAVIGEDPPEPERS